MTVIGLKQDSHNDVEPQAQIPRRRHFSALIASGNASTLSKIKRTGRRMVRQRAPIIRRAKTCAKYLGDDINMQQNQAAMMISSQTAEMMISSQKTQAPIGPVIMTFGAMRACVTSASSAWPSHCAHCGSLSLENPSSFARSFPSNEPSK